MPRTTRFHLDENGPRAVAEGLRRLGIDVTTTPEAGLRGATDDEQLAYCQATARVLFTRDEDFLRIAATGVPHAGIAYCHARKAEVGYVVRRLAQLWERMEPEQMAGWIVYL